MACEACRKRNLNCDGSRPKCSRCVRLRHECDYSDHKGRRPSFRRGLSGLEEQLVDYVNQTDGALKNPNSYDILASVDVFNQYNKYNDDNESPRADSIVDESDYEETLYDSGSETDNQHEDDTLDSTILADEIDGTELVSLKTPGPRFNEAVKAELTELFFCDVYPNIPIIHKSRYYASLDLPPEQQPPLCLRYAMWALAAIQDLKWNHLATALYDRARAYLEQDEMRAAGTEVLNVAHVQCWSLIATYESYMLLSLRTWSSIRRAAALANVLRLHSMDEPAELTNDLLPEAQDPLELEERRRAFWSAFSGDRWVSSRTGYPMTIPEHNITTKLPSSENSFSLGAEEETQSLNDALEMGLEAKTSLFGARAVIACILGRVMQHIKSAASLTKPSDNNQQFWRQHAKLDTLLSRISQTRSPELRPSSSTTDLKLWALDMWLHGLAICLHQTAIDYAKDLSKPEQVKESMTRCREAADHIIQSTRSIAHIYSRKMDPFTASCIYMAATVLFRGHDYGDCRSTDIEDLRYLQQVLEHMYRHWKVTEIFITQFNEDLERSGISLLLGEKNEQLSRKRYGEFEPIHQRSRNEHFLSDFLPV